MSARRTLAAAATVTAVVAGLVAVQALPGAAPAQASGLTAYGGCDDLVAHYRDQLRDQASAWPGGVVTYDAMEGAVAGTARADGATAADAVGAGVTGTNVQEQGVDEPDVTKLADGRLVTLADRRLLVVTSTPQPRLLGSVRVAGDPFYPVELLLVGERALVVSSGWRPTPGQGSGGDDPRALDSARLIAPGTEVTRLSLYDVAGGVPSLLEESTYDGRYVSARLVDGTVRLVTSSSPQLPIVYPKGPSAADRLAARTENETTIERAGRDAFLPRVVRTDSSGDVLEQGAAVSCDETYFARGARGTSTLLVTTMRPADGLTATDSTAVTTDGDLVYSSTGRLYVATSQWATVMPVDAARGGAAESSEPDEVTTQVHAFDISSATGTDYIASGSVPGYVYGRWAFSEHEGVLRVATTRQPPWRPEAAEDVAGASSSMVVKLAEAGGKLVETGRLGGLGRTEHIKAVRYFGDLAAVVTFRQTDPLYLLDLSGDPRLLGELKVPGFSTYLHPIGDGLLLGLGHEATDQGQVTGMQLSVFDISDPSAPRQVDRLQLGAGYSPALDDSRAFSYDPTRRLAALTLVAYDEETYEENASAVGVRVAADGSLSTVGGIRLGLDAWQSRVLVGTDSVFAVTPHEVVTGDPNTFARIGSLRL